jgi:hypothetical protein
VPSILCPAIVGRLAELAVLVGLLGSPSGGAVFVHGEAGHRPVSGSFAS